MRKDKNHIRKKASIVFLVLALSMTITVIADARINQSTTAITKPTGNQATLTDNQTTLVITNITSAGRSITATIANNGSAAANDIFMKMTVTGGILHQVNKSAVNAALTIPVNSSFKFSEKGFFGFGKITIVVYVRSANAPDATKTATGTIIGFRVYKIV